MLTSRSAVALLLAAVLAHQRDAAAFENPIAPFLDLQFVNCTIGSTFWGCLSGSTPPDKASSNPRGDFPTAPQRQGKSSSGSTFELSTSPAANNARQEN